MVGAVRFVARLDGAARARYSPRPMLAASVLDEILKWISVTFPAAPALRDGELCHRGAQRRAEPGTFGVRETDSAVGHRRDDGARRDLEAELGRWRAPH